MRVAIVGGGASGLRHLANLRAIVPQGHLVLCHLGPPGRAPSPGEELADAVVHGVAAALEHRPDAAVVACPSSMHTPVATALAEAGAHLLLEKPLADRLEGTLELIDTCARLRRVLMVGYNFRFYPPLCAMKQALAEGRIGRVLCLRAEVGQYLPEWRPSRDYRLGCSARRECGGGVVLELSHEIDYLRWLGGEVRGVYGEVAKLSDLELDVEDTAELILRFEGGAIGSVHLDMVRRPASRSCAILGTEGTLEWSLATNAVRLYAAAAGAWADLVPARALDRNEMYLEELRQFLRCVETGARPAVSGEDGRRVVEIAVAAKASSERREFVAL